MQLNVGDEPIKLPYISSAGIYSGKVESVREVLTDTEGNPVSTPYLEVKFIASAGVHTEKFWLTEKAGPRLRALYFGVTGKDLQGTVDTSVFKDLEGVNVAFKVVPDINASTGKVYYRMPYDRFVSTNLGDLAFTESEKTKIEEAKALLTNSETPGETDGAKDDFPF